MAEMEQQLENLTTGGAWSRCPWDYNLIDYLAFRQDGSGILAVGYGQRVLGRAFFRFEVPEVGCLRLTYADSPDNRRRTPKGLVPWHLEVVETIELSFTLRAGDFSGDMNMGTESGPFWYAMKSALELDGPPYPAWLSLPSVFFQRKEPAPPWQTRY